MPFNIPNNFRSGRQKHDKNAQFSDRNALARAPHSRCSMKQGVLTWGTRLSDAMRAALAGGDVATARHFALQGDGQTRDLAREYALMVRVLGSYPRYKG